MSLLAIVALPFLLAPAALIAGRAGKRPAAVVAAVAPLGTLALAVTLLPAVLGGAVPAVDYEWLTAAGLALSLRLDGLALMFVLLVAAIGLLVVIYAAGYLAADDPPGRFYAFLLLFMGSMLGVVTAGNLILLGVFWELTSLSSFLLIGFWHHNPAARQGARMALATTGLGGLALLGGLVLLGNAAGSMQLADVLAAGDQVRAHPWYPVILALVLLGAFTKSAQVPFQFWLPRAMTAPTPVSAYLHSATMVKAGVFLLARLLPTLGGTPEWNAWVGGVGATTAALAAYWAMFQTDLKGLLAYSTISHLGIITACFGFGSRVAVIGGVLHILNHAAFKAGLFMTAGNVDHEAGTRDLRQLGGLRRAMPLTATLAVLGALAMAGVPPLGGFISKEMFVDASLTAGFGAAALAAVAALSGAVYALRYAHGTFFGAARDTETAERAHEAPTSMLVPPAVLMAVALLLGLWPGAAERLVAVAAGATAGRGVRDLHLTLWHGFNLPLALSAVALVGGVLVYRGLRRLPRPGTGLDGKRAFDAVVAAASRLSRTLVRGLARESSANYTAWLVLAMAAALWSGLAFAPAAGTRALLEVDVAALAGWGLLVFGTGATIAWRDRRVAAVIAAGMVGLVCVLAFARFSAPDLALTQLSVEVVTVVLLLLALGILPANPIRDSETRLRRLGTGAVAAALGTGAGLAAWEVLTRHGSSISRVHLTESVPGGGGSNVVNVILVDFRGFDTMGEISVLAIAALGVFALVQGLRVSDRPAPGRQRALDRHPLILTVITQPLLPVALVIAAYVFLRGHNQPGGGFVAGLVTAIALIVQYLASGADWAGARLKLPFETVLGAGLAIAGATGAVAMALGHPFLTSAHTHVHPPLLGEFEVASAAAFDLGVFLVVVGATLLMLTRLSRIRERHAEDDLRLAESRDPWKP